MDTKSLPCSNTSGMASANRWLPAGPGLGLVLDLGSCKQLPPSEIRCSALWDAAGLEEWTEQVGWGQVWSSKKPGDSAATSIFQPIPRPRALAGSLEPVPEGEEKAKRKEKMKCMFTKQPHLSPSTLSNFLLGFQLTGDVRPQVG